MPYLNSHKWNPKTLTKYQIKHDIYQCMLYPFESFHFEWVPMVSNHLPVWPHVQQFQPINCTGCLFKLKNVKWDYLI